LHYTREIGYHEIDFLFISGKLQSIGIEVESILKQEVVELVRIRAIKGIQNAGLRLIRFWY